MVITILKTSWNLVKKLLYGLGIIGLATIGGISLGFAIFGWTMFVLIQLIHLLSPSSPIILGPTTPLKIMELSLAILS